MESLRGIQICLVLGQRRIISSGGLGYRGTTVLSGGLGRHHAADDFTFQMRYEAGAHCERTSKAAVTLSAPRGKRKRRSLRKAKYDKKTKKGWKETSKVYALSKPQQSVLQIHFCFEKMSFNGEVLLTAQYEEAGDTWNFPTYKAGSQKTLKILNATAFSLCFLLLRIQKNPTQDFTLPLVEAMMFLHSSTSPSPSS